jgi:zinc/manganese transport system substrate-binding protein
VPMTARRRLVALLAGALATALLAACGAGGGAEQPGAATTLVATTTQLGDLARAVAGNRAGVRQILEPNSDPHAYEPRPSDVRAIAGAKVVVRSGGDLDAWLDDVLRNAGSGARTLTIIDALRARRGPGGIDPHWWQDPRNAVIAVGRIRDALIAADPAGRATYAANAGRYVAKLRALDRAIASCMARIPAHRRRLVTDHDALGYYAARYAIEVVGTVIPALSSQAQASGGEVARLVRTIRAERVSTIFPESSVNAKLTRAIARDAGARVGPALYADSLGASGSPGATYLGSLRANTQALAAGFSAGRLRCALPG